MEEKKKKDEEKKWEKGPKAACTALPLPPELRVRTLLKFFGVKEFPK